MARKAGRAADRAAAAAAARAAVAAAKRRQRRLAWGIGAAVVIVVAALISVAIIVGGSGSSEKSGSNVPRTPMTTAVGRTTLPPWPAPSNATAAATAAGLPMLGSEGTVEHIHAHLDVIVDGSHVTVPADIGIDPAAQQISPLHTHDTTGVIHIESPVKVPFSLGQFLTEWQVSASATHLGGLTVGGDKLLRAYVNGKPYTGDPAAITLGAHDEIALVYGTAAQQANPPASYQFPAGE